MKRPLVIFLSIFLLILLFGFVGFLCFFPVASYQGALRDIYTAEVENHERLYIITGNLISLPPQIGNLKNLRRLSVQYNFLRNLPPEIGNLRNLTMLSLPDNILVELPPEIGNLTNLTWLVLDD